MPYKVPLKFNTRYIDAKGEPTEYFQRLLSELVQGVASMQDLQNAETRAIPSSAGIAAEAEALARGALTRQQSHRDTIGDAQRVAFRIPIEPHRDLQPLRGPALPPQVDPIAAQRPQRSWSIVNVLVDTEANIGNYPSAAYPQSFYIASDVFTLYYSGDGTAWTQLGAFDDAYGVGWNNSRKWPTQNTVYDAVEAVIATIAAFNPQVTTVIALTARTATAGPTDIASTGTQWILEYTLMVTTADGGSAATLTVSVDYTDAIGATSQAGAAVAVTATNRQTGRFIIQRASGNISYTVTVTGAIGGAQYAFSATLERKAA